MRCDTDSRSRLLSKIKFHPAGKISNKLNETKQVARQAQATVD
jgi:hypothetical protein